MINKAELERATQKYQMELHKATQDLQAKTTELEKYQKGIPMLRKEIMDMQGQVDKKKVDLMEATQKVDHLKPEIPRLEMEMKRAHQELENFTRTQATALKDTGVEGIRHKF